MGDEQVRELEARHGALAREMEDQRSRLSFIDDRLVAAELVIYALVRRLRSEQGAIAEVREWVTAWTESEGEEGRRIAGHAEDLLAADSAPGRHGVDGTE